LLIEIIFLYEVTGVSSSSMCSLENSLNSWGFGLNNITELRK
jgi:hypothetical protein